MECFVNFVCIFLDMTQFIFHVALCSTFLRLQIQSTKNLACAAFAFRSEARMNLLFEGDPFGVCTMAMCAVFRDFHTNKIRKVRS